MMKKLMIGAGIAATLIAGAAIAQQAAPEAGAPHGWARMLAKVDTNKDGAISLDETLAAAKARFAKHDTNNDSKITEQEAMAWRQQHHDMMGGKRGGGWRRGGEDGPGGRGGPGGPGGMGGPGAMLERLDADHDGKLTRAEFDMPFDRMDANHDGVVDQAEMQTAREMMRSRMDQMRSRGGPDAPPPDTGT